MDLQPERDRCSEAHHVGFNPVGCLKCLYSFKAPNSTELDHIYFWRHQLALPARGEIAIHNRSHYENVLMTRVHPEYVLNENIPGIDDIKSEQQGFLERSLQSRSEDLKESQNKTERSYWSSSAICRKRNKETFPEGLITLARTGSFRFLIWKNAASGMPIRNMRSDLETSTKNSLVCGTGRW